MRLRPGRRRRSRRVRSREFAWGEIPPGDEDCLYLNVWTPRSGSGPWPVLVWSIGGGFTVGWTGSGLDDGALLADAAEIVVVSFSYRLGSLGWAFGNWGLLDHVAVLEWVRREIAAFGGDPERVTVGGQSAGAAAVADLLVCPAADGLFARAILHSPPLPEAANDSERRARWERDLGVTRDTAAADIVARHEALLGEGEWRGTRGAAMPTLDPAVLPVSPMHAPGARIDVPVLAGTTRDEATFLLRTAGRDAPDEQVSRADRASVRRADTAVGARACGRRRRGPPVPDRPRLARPAARRAAHDRRAAAVRHVCDERGRASLRRRRRRHARALSLDAGAVGEVRARRAARLAARRGPRDRRLRLSQIAAAACLRKRFRPPPAR